MALCKCGCGREANWGEWIKGHWNTGKHPSAETLQKISQGLMGHKVSDETKRKISIAQTGKHISSETRQKLSKSLIGRQCTEEHKQNMSQSHIGHPVSDETRQKISQTQIGRKLSGEHRQKISQGLITHGRDFILNRHRKHKKQECLFGCTDCNYDMHHEPPYENILVWEGHLINLCQSCHGRVHADSLVLPEGVGILWTLEDTREEEKLIRL